MRKTEDELRAILRGRRRRGHGRGPERQPGLRQRRRNRAAGRRRAVMPLRQRVDEMVAGLRVTDERGAPGARGTTARQAGAAGEQPAPLVLRYRAGGSGEAALLAREGDAGVRRARARAAGDQRLRGHHRDRAGRGGPALPGAELHAPRRTRSTSDETLPALARLAVPEIADWCADPPAAGPPACGASPWRTATRPTSRWRKRCAGVPAGSNERAARRASSSTGKLELYASIPEDALGGDATTQRQLHLLRSLGMVSAMCGADARPRPGARSDHPHQRGVRPPLRAAATSPSPRTSACGRGRRSTTPGSIARGRRSRRRCRPRCCPRCCRRSPGSRPRRCSAPPARGMRSAATSTTCSRPARSQWFAVMGDVCGKGAEAAAVTALARYTIRAAVVRHRSPPASCSGSTTRCCDSGSTRAGSRRWPVSGWIFDADGVARPWPRGGHPCPRSCVPPAWWRSSAPRARCSARCPRAPRGPDDPAGPGRRAGVLHRRADRGGSAEARLVAGNWTRPSPAPAARKRRGSSITSRAARSATRRRPLRDDIALLAVRAV